MTDSHCHAAGAGARHFLCAAGPDDWSALTLHAPGDAVFYGIHPWFAAAATEADFVRLRELLRADPAAGVGEIGLDRMRLREIPPVMDAVFARQLDLAAELERPVQVHGAKCWGRAVAACARYAGRIPAFLFHAFSRSAGLIPEMVRLGGYISVGPALLNDHAVNYRELVRALPLERLLVESDRTPENPGVERVDSLVETLAVLHARPVAELGEILEANAARFLSGGAR